MRMQYGLSSFQRSRGDLPELVVLNMFAEEAPTEEGGVILQSRPALVDRSADMGSGPIRALFQGDGVLDSGLYGVSGSNLYRATTSLGAVTGTGPFSLAGYEDNLFVAGGAGISIWNGTTLSALSFPDGANVIKVLVAAGRLIAIRADTEKFYWSEPLATTVTALNFATAENQPDRLRDALFMDDILVLAGAETTEFWPNTSDSDLPFQPLEGRVFEVGVKNTGALCRYGTTFAMVTNQNHVIISDQDNIVSQPGLDALIAASTSAFLYTFLIDGTEFLALRIDAGTWVYNRRSGTFSTFETYGLGDWTPSCHANGVFGSSVDGKTYAFSGYLDQGTVLERRFRAGMPINGGGMMIDNIMLRCNVGGTGYLTGDYTDPIIEMRLSRNAGKTWGEWKARTLGEQGEYRKKVRWSALGMASAPGLFAEFRVTAPVDFRVAEVLVNEPLGGV
jgi:hypothetical protein